MLAGGTVAFRGEGFGAGDELPEAFGLGDAQEGNFAAGVGEFVEPVEITAALFEGIRWCGTRAGGGCSDC